MLKKKIQFKDLDGNVVEETFYFNLSKAEIAEMELRTPGGLAEYVKIVVADAKVKPGPLIDLFKDIISKSYGERSIDNRRFHKSAEIFENFQATDAYSELFWELCTNATAAGDFFNAVVADALDGKKIQDVELPESKMETKDRIEHYTVSQLTNMSIEEFREVGRKFKNNLSKEYIQVAMRRTGESEVRQLTQTIPTDNRPIWLKNDRYPDEAELKAMTKEDFLFYQTDLYRLMHKNK